MTEQRQRIGYALREDFLGEGETYLGGIVAAGDVDLDIAAELDAGNGVIVVATSADPRIITALDERPELERVPVEDDAAVTVTAVGADDPDVELEELTLGELRQRNPDLEGAGKARKADLITAIVERDARTAEGTLDELEAVNVDTLVAAAAEREEA